MKTSLSGAIGEALKDLQVSVVTNVPGYGASEAYKSYALVNSKIPVLSFHEEVAYSVSHGAALVGKRSATMMKAQGFVKAGNAAVDSLYTSLSAGFVILIFEDLTGKHSDNIMEIEPILKGMSFPYKRATKENIYENLISCYRESEIRKMPYALLINADEINAETEFTPKNIPQPENRFERNILAQVVHPLLADYQYKVFTTKKISPDFSGIARPRIPSFPDDFPLRYKQGAQKYVVLFDALKNLRGDVVTGDTSVSSSFAFPPYNSIDLVTHLGGSIPLATGAYLAGYKDVWAITGDFSFLAAGHLGLIEAFERAIPLKIIILYNKEAGATGGQKIHRRIMMRVLAGYQNFIKHISDPQDVMEVVSVLEEAKNADELRIILADY